MEWRLLKKYHFLFENVDMKQKKTLNHTSCGSRVWLLKKKNHVNFKIKCKTLSNSVIRGVSQLWLSATVQAPPTWLGFCVCVCEVKLISSRFADLLLHVGTPQTFKVPAAETTVVKVRTHTCTSLDMHKAAARL